jgi:hypothetical protein
MRYWALGIGCWDELVLGLEDYRLSQDTSKIEVNVFARQLLWFERRGSSMILYLCASVAKKPRVPKTKKASIQSEPFDLECLFN